MTLHLQDALYCSLLIGDLDKRSPLTDLPAKWDDAAEITPPLSLIGLHFTDALANAVALCFCNGRKNCKDEL
jgi:hypothetical protein